MPSAMGSVPISAAMVVIMMGRKRTMRRFDRSPARPGCCSLRCRCSAKSIIMIAFFLTMPISMIMPTKA